MCQIRCFKYHSKGYELHYLVYSRKCFASSTISRNLCSSKTSAENILYHFAVRWSSIGETSRRVLQLQKEIVEYYSTKSKECSLLDKDFLMSLGFLKDFFTQGNFLNQSLQGKATTLCLVYKKVQDFCDKNRLLKSHLHQRNFFHFAQMKTLIDSKEIQVDDIPIILFSSVIDGVLQEFFNCFQEYERISDTTRLVAYPHLVETETAPLNLQMELVESKNDEQFVKKFEDEEDLLDTCRGAVKYPNLQELAKKTLVLFGTTYVCEAGFSRMKDVKNKYRTQLSESNLECGLRLMISSEPPNLASLSEEMQDQGSQYNFVIYD